VSASNIGISISIKAQHVPTKIFGTGYDRKTGNEIAWFAEEIFDIKVSKS
jgi:hypothetical protein